MVAVEGGELNIQFRLQSDGSRKRARSKVDAKVSLSESNGRSDEGIYILYGRVGIWLADG